MKLTASDVPHSSVVGSSIKVCDDDGKVLAILAILVPNPDLDYKTIAQEVSNQILWKMGKRPVAFRVKDFADGWILFTSEKHANHESEAMGGALLQGLYTRDGT